MPEINNDKSHNRIIYDWVTFTSKIDSPQSIIDRLGLGDVSFIELAHGFNGYPHCLHFGGISICYGGREDMGVCCSMSGKGCRAFETYGNGDYNSLFDYIIEHYSEDSDKRELNLTRLDVAYDDFEGLLDMQTIHQATIAGGYKDCKEIDVNGRTCTYYKLYQGDFVSRFNSYEVTISSEGMTCGYGSMRSDTYIRIYDKLSEQHAPDVDHWVRCEIQLRRGNAIGFAMLTGDICTNYFGVLNNYLRFIAPSDTDSNKRRSDTAVWWSKFLESTDRLHIYQKPGIDYDIMCLDGYVYKQCAGAVYTMIELVGIDEFMRRLDEAVKLRPRNKKYIAIRDQWLGLQQARLAAV